MAAILVVCVISWASSAHAVEAVPGDSKIARQAARDADSAGSVEGLPTICPVGEPRVAFTYQRADGNRLAAGRSELPGLPVIRIELGATPRWLAALQINESAVLWAALLEGGGSRGFIVDPSGVSSVPLHENASLASGPQLVLDAGGRAAFFSGLVVHGGVFVLHDDSLVDCSRGRSAILASAPLHDANLVAAGASKLMYLASPTLRYPHAVLGDAVEAGAVALLDVSATPTLTGVLEVPTPQVIEGRMPMWADLDGDGREEVIVTVSDPETGARIVAYAPAGRKVAEGPSAGRGFRWRHAIAVAPFGFGAETELVEVLTPHIGGVVQYYRLRGERLEVVARLSGYSSHQLGSRNLDMAAAGDFDGDGRVELLVPEQNHRRLAALRRTRDGVEQAWVLDLGGQLSTNLATAVDENGRMSLGLGTDQGALLLWQPRESHAANALSGRQVATRSGSDSWPEIRRRSIDAPKPATLREERP